MMADKASKARSAGGRTTEVAADRRLSALDALRGVAILLVIIGHYVPGRLVEGPLASLLRPFAVGGVVLFFLLSGFLIERNLLRQPDPVAYALRRAFRILPAYWLCLLVLLIVHRGFMGQTDFAAPRDFIANALLMTDIFRAPELSAVFWTLLIESKFYLLAPFLTLGGRRAIVAAPFVAVAANAIILVSRGAASNLLTYLTFCLAGMNFALWHRRELSNAMLVIIVTMAAAAIGIFSPYVKAGLVVFTILNAAALEYALH